jgi:iron-sulfur cluster insertion protein
MSQPAEAMYQEELTGAQLSLTPAALEKMKELMADIEDDEVEAVRVFVTGGGCSGMTYGMTFTNLRSPYDSVRNADGVKIYVDAVALNYLKGVEIDFVEQQMGASFVFNNVFAATGGSGVCGACGAAGGGCA